MPRCWSQSQSTPRLGAGFRPFSVTRSQLAPKNLRHGKLPFVMTSDQEPELREAWVDRLVFRVTEFSADPSPENVASVAEVVVSGGRIDRHGLRDAIEKVLPWPNTFSELYTVTEWGASGAGLEIAIGVASGAAVLVLEQVLEVIRARLKKDPVIPLENTPEAAVRQARWILSAARNVPPDSIVVDSVEAMDDGFRLRL